MEAVILIHGFLTNIDDFKNLVPYLESKYDKVCLCTIPGHTIPPKYKLFNVNDTFKTILETYDNLTLEYDEIDCIGFSMGGALATYLQSVRNIRKLVLLAPANKYLNFSLLHNRLQFIKKVKKESKIREDLDYKKEELNILTYNDKESLKIMFKELLPNYTPHNLQTFIKIVKKCNKELITISVPVLIIWGKLDQLVPYGSVKYLYDIAISKKELIIYDDISHLMLNSENYQKIVDDIMKFLKE